MGRLLVGVSGALFGAALLAADPVPTVAHGSWLPTLGALALGGLLGPLFGGSGFGAAFILTLLGVAAAVAMRVFGRPRSEAPAPPPAATQARAGFDAAALLRGAKLDFVKLQAARDLGRMDPVRAFTTAEMYDKLTAEGRARPTDVVALNAELLELGVEAGRQLASVRFSGMARAAPGAEPVGFVQVWSLARPADGASGWLLAGIQPMH